MYVIVWKKGWSHNELIYRNFVIIVDLVCSFLAIAWCWSVAKLSYMYLLFMSIGGQVEYRPTKQHHLLIYTIKWREKKQNKRLINNVYVWNRFLPSQKCFLDSWDLCLIIIVLQYNSLLFSLPKEIYITKCLVN